MILYIGIIGVGHAVWLFKNGKIWNFDGVIIGQIFAHLGASVSSERGAFWPRFSLKTKMIITIFVIIIIIFILYHRILLPNTSFKPNVVAPFSRSSIWPSGVSTTLYSPVTVLIIACLYVKVYICVYVYASIYLYTYICVLFPSDYLVLFSVALSVDILSNKNLLSLSLWKLKIMQRRF